MEEMPLKRQYISTTIHRVTPAETLKFLLRTWEVSD